MAHRPDTSGAVPDSEHGGLLRLLPASARPYALLARFDRPIGWWLLFWPCAFGLALAGGLAIEGGGQARWDLLLWLLLGAIAMRGAGCVYNDIVDRDLDRQVARTAARPLASGAVTVKAAWLWLGLLCLVGLIAWLQLNWTARLVSLGSLALVAAYPFMKRITWWPQAWLGLVFSWGALVGWTAWTDTLPTGAILLYAGCVFWVIGYDTIYALQDREDDALIGIRSSALRMGAHVKAGITSCYLAALAFWLMAFSQRFPDPFAYLALLPAGLHFAWQVATLRTDDGANALERFRSNRFAGLLIALACFVVGTA